MTDAATASPTQSITRYRKDYRPPTHLVDTLELEFDLADEHTSVRARMTLRSNLPQENQNGKLVLDGVGLELVRIAVDVGREALVFVGALLRHTLARR